MIDKYFGLLFLCRQRSCNNRAPSRLEGQADETATQAERSAQGALVPGGYPGKTKASCMNNVRDTGRFQKK